MCPHTDTKLILILLALDRHFYNIPSLFPVSMGLVKVIIQSKCFTTGVFIIKEVFLLFLVLFHIIMLLAVSLYNLSSLPDFILLGCLVLHSDTLKIICALMRFYMDFSFAYAILCVCIHNYTARFF